VKVVEKQSLGEEKQGTCAWCETSFAKKRHDQRFCSPECSRKGKKAAVPWIERHDRARLNAARNARYYANHEESKRKQNEWRRANPERVREVARAEYQRNKVAHAERSRAYRAKNTPDRNAEYKRAKEKRPWRAALINARHRSLKKGFAFDLTREWCEQNWTGFCAVSGLPFSFGTQTHFPFSPSIDRIRSDLGYTASNCRFVLFAVNSFKGTGTDEDMLLIAKAIIIQHQKELFPILYAIAPDEDFAETRL
jgi:hypothetical protein